MSDVLAQWNTLPLKEAVEEILPCCGSSAWARGLAAHRPFKDFGALASASDEVWGHLQVQDWLEAFAKHPRIGERKAPGHTPAQSAVWSEQEQQKVGVAGEAVQLALRQANQEYERRFGRVFIVCATGKSADEMLEILRRRLQNDDMTELQEAAEEQRKITNLRLKKWLSR